jgi:hypothetical protein
MTLQKLAQFFASDGYSFYLRRQLIMSFRALLLTVIAALLLLPPAVMAQPPANLHHAWDDLLKKYVSTDGAVNYRSFKSDRAQLEAYLKSLAANPPAASWKRTDQMAYWINAYNAVTVKAVLDHYPLKSIRDIDGGKVWEKPAITIGGKSYSLNNIEHDMLRKNFNDPRIHFAVNCASASCPKLINEAFSAEKLEAQLHAATKYFINDASRNKISANNLQLSAIFDWYKQDFMAKGTLVDFLNQYSATRISPGASISYLQYDWSLNE